MSSSVANDPVTNSAAMTVPNEAAAASSAPVAARPAAPVAAQDGFFNDLKILWHLATAPGKGTTHEERLENFYSGQASGYDSFRRRMLHGRAELFQKLTVPAGGVWVDLGAGTGENAEHWGERIGQLGHGYLVDLSSSLLKVAEVRIQQRGWSNISAVHADATQFLPPEGRADLVTMSYSLTMIPDWFRALEHAHQLLKPGGRLAIVDFFVSRKYPGTGHVRHGWATRTFWTTWFATDNVFLSPDHLPFLESRFETELLEERRGKIPYLPLVRAPYYLYVGRKRDDSATTG